MNNQNYLRPAKIRTYFIPKNILEESFTYLRRYGKRRYEGYMCWAGIVVNQTDALIRSCVYPMAYKKSRFRGMHAGLNLQVVYEIGNQVFSRGEFLFAQLHTHGFEAFHSDVDDNFPISHKTGFISIVVPFFANNKFYNDTTLIDCSVNEHMGGGRWRELNPSELKKRFRVTGVDKA
jgi:hypothetical protein